MGHDILEIALLYGTLVAYSDIEKLLGSIQKTRISNHGSDPQKFIAQMQASPPDVVLVDIRGENNFPLWLEQLIQRLPQTPILVCSEKREADFIIQAMQMGIRELLSLPLSKTNLEAALNRLQITKNRFQPEKEDKLGQILVVTGHKGGVGCTTVAINLAVALSNLTAERVALIDLGRPFPDVANFLNQQPNFSFANLIDNPSQLDRSFTESIMQPYETQLAILYGMPGLGDREGMEEVLDRIFLILRNMYKYIVIDLGPWLDKFFLQVCIEANMVLMLTQLTIPDLKNLGIFLDMLLEMQLERRKIKIVVNRYIRRHIVQLGDLDRIIKHSAFHTLSSDYFSSMKAIDLGTILANGAPRSKLWNSITKLGTLILEEIGN